MTPGSFTVLLPCFNEEDGIARSLEQLHGWFGASAEVIVLDDGSTDDSVAAARRFAASHPRIRVHRLAHGGKGRACREGIALAQCESVVILDADLAYGQESIARALAALSDADVAIGNRRHHGSRYSVPVRLFGFLYRRHLAGLAFNAFVRTVLPIRHRDTQCGLKAFRLGALRRIGRVLTIDGFAIDVEILAAARALKLTVAEVPVSVTYQTAKSSVKLIRSGSSITLEVLAIAQRYARGAYRA